MLRQKEAEEKARWEALTPEAQEEEEYRAWCEPLWKAYERFTDIAADERDLRLMERPPPLEGYPSPSRPELVPGFVWPTRKELIAHRLREKEREAVRRW